jgi:hypothetical protein
MATTSRRAPLNGVTFVCIAVLLAGASACSSDGGAKGTGGAGGHATGAGGAGGSGTGGAAKGGAGGTATGGGGAGGLGGARAASGGAAGGTSGAAGGASGAAGGAGGTALGGAGGQAAVGGGHGGSGLGGGMGGGLGGAGGGGGAAVATTANLIVNGGADAAVGSTDAAPVAVPGWTVTGSATALQYDVSGYPSSTDPGPADRGANLFIGGADGASASLTQTISLAGYAAAIDANKVTFALAGYLGGYSQQDDNATLTVAFENTTGTVLSTATIGPVLAADRGNETGLLLRNATGAVPAAARSAVVTLTMMRTSGTADDGYADSLSLVLTGI